MATVSSQREYAQYGQVLRGIDRSVKPHLISDEAWYDALDMRFNDGRIRMRNKLTEWTNVGDAYPLPINLISQIPRGSNDHTKILVFSPAEVWAYNGDSPTFDSASYLLEGDNGFEVPITYRTLWSGIRYVPTRWSSFVHDDRIFFANQHNKLRWTDGAKVRLLSASPRARHVELFYDHVVAADVSYIGFKRPQRVMWSDLYKIEQWAPTRGNEADYYDCTDVVRPAPWAGCAGMGQIGPLLFIYTPTVIYSMRYVGLPHVMKTDPAVRDIGCDMPYGLARLDKKHFFVSRLYKNFFSFDGGQVVPIGDAIANYFFDDLTTDASLADMTYTMVDEENTEIRWVYVSKNAVGDYVYDKAVVYNYEDNTWYPFSVEDIHSFCPCGAPSNNCKDWDAPTWEDVSQDGSIDQLSRRPKVGRLYGGSGGRLLIEDRGSDIPIQTPTPFLETKDFIYQDMGSTTEIESMIINAAITSQSSNSLEVYYSARESVDDAVSFTKAPQDWVSTLAERRLSFPRAAGKVVRYRFQPKVLNSTAWPAKVRHMVRLESKGVTETVVELSDDGRWRVPADAVPGTFEIEMVGAGGGGGAQGLTDPSLISTSNPLSATKVWFYRTSDAVRRKIEREIVRAALTTLPLELYHTGFLLPAGSYNVGFLDDGGSDPNLMIGSSVADFLYNLVVLDVESWLDENSKDLVSYHLFLLEKLAHPQNYYDATALAGGEKTLLSTSLGQSIWVPKAIFSTVASGASELKRAGGGGGSYYLARFSLTAPDAGSYFNYLVGVCPDHTVYNDAESIPWHSDGNDGASSAFWKSGDLTIEAFGGTGGGYNGAVFVNGAGGGVPTVADPLERITKTLFQLAGENSTAESLPSTKARGGKAWLEENEKTGSGRMSDGTGYAYGGGGCGQKKNFGAVGSGSSGADGRIVLRWRRATT